VESESDSHGWRLEVGLLSNFDGRNSVLHVPIFVSRSDSSERITYGANVRNMNERMLRTFGNITEQLCFYNKNAQNPKSRWATLSLTRKLGGQRICELIDFDSVYV